MGVSGESVSEVAIRRLRRASWRRQHLTSRSIWILLALQIVLAGGALGAWVRSRELAPQPSTLPPMRYGPANTGPASLESAYPLAVAEAQRWNSDAELLSAEEEIDWPVTAQDPTAEDAPAGGWLVYVFVAPYDHFGLNTSAATLSVLIERNGVTIANRQTEAWEYAPKPLAVQPVNLKISSTAALTAAESAVGRAFREDCPAARHVTRIGLGAGADGAPLWTVTYTQDRDDGNNALTIPINAQTGAVGPIADRAPACGPTTASMEPQRRTQLAGAVAYQDSSPTSRS